MTLQASVYISLCQQWTKFDGSIVFFSGSQVYRYSGTELDFGYPKNVTEEFIIPKGTFIPKRFDAAIHWDSERLTYLFYDDQFWKIDEYYADRKPRVLLIGQYSRTLWAGVPSNLDSAFIDRKGKGLICCLYLGSQEPK